MRAILKLSVCLAVASVWAPLPSLAGSRVLNILKNGAEELGESADEVGDALRHGNIGSAIPPPKVLVPPTGNILRGSADNIGKTLDNVVPPRVLEAPRLDTLNGNLGKKLPVGVLPEPLIGKNLPTGPKITPAQLPPAPKLNAGGTLNQLDNTGGYKNLPIFKNADVGNGNEYKNLPIFKNGAELPNGNRAGIYEGVGEALDGAADAPLTKVEKTGAYGNVPNKQPGYTRPGTPEKLYQGELGNGGYGVVDLNAPNYTDAPSLDGGIYTRPPARRPPAEYLPLLLRDRPSSSVGAALDDAKSDRRLLAGIGVAVTGMVAGGVTAGVMLSGVTFEAADPVTGGGNGNGGNAGGSGKGGVTILPGGIMAGGEEPVDDTPTQGSGGGTASGGTTVGGTATGGSAGTPKGSGTSTQATPGTTQPKPTGGGSEPAGDDGTVTTDGGEDFGEDGGSAGQPGQSVIIHVENHKKKPIWVYELLADGSSRFIIEVKSHFARTLNLPSGTEIFFTASNDKKPFGRHKARLNKNFKLKDGNDRS